MERITKTQVTQVFRQYVAACRRVGYDTTNWTLVEGSKPNGVAWRVYDHGSGTMGTADRGFIGSTAREAYETLSTITRTLGDLDYDARNGRRKA